MSGTRRSPLSRPSAEAHLTGDLAVCAGSCGPGNLHLMNGLFDCHRSRVPVLAIAAQVPSAEIGAGYFQETHPESLFKECSHYCELISGANQMPRTLEIAIRQAVGNRRRLGRGHTWGRGASVRRRRATAESGGPSSPPCDRDAAARRCRSPRHAAQWIGRVTMLCGSGCQGAHDQVLALADRLKAPIVHDVPRQGTYRVGQPFDVGMTGLIGFSSGYYAMLDCDVLLMLGTDFPYRQFYPRGAGVCIAQVDIRPENIGRARAS